MRCSRRPTTSRRSSTSSSPTGWRETVAGAYRLTEAGHGRGRRRCSHADRTRGGSDAADAALDAFLDLDHRMKDVVTAWQLRDDASGQVVNDHSDVAYDRTVLDRLAALHADAVAWFTRPEPAVRDWRGYRIRLGRAIDQALAGDQRYVASPRVDSYHGTGSSSTRT